MRRPWHVSRAPIAACESTCVNGVEWWRYTSITLLDQVLRYNELWLCFNDTEMNGCKIVEDVRSQNRASLNIITFAFFNGG